MQEKRYQTFKKFPTSLFFISISILNVGGKQNKQIVVNIVDMQISCLSKSLML